MLDANTDGALKASNWLRVTEVTVSTISTVYGILGTFFACTGNIVKTVTSVTLDQSTIPK